MAKKAAKGEPVPPAGAQAKKGYRPQKGVMVRLPASHRGPLEALQARHRRPIVTEVTIALEKHYKEEGIDFPADQGPAR